MRTASLVLILLSGALAGNPSSLRSAQVQKSVAVAKGIPQTGWKDGKPPADKMPVDVGDRVMIMGRMLPTHLDGQTHTADWGNEYGPAKPVALHSGAPAAASLAGLCVAIAVAQLY